MEPHAERGITVVQASRVFARALVDHDAGAAQRAGGVGALDAAVRPGGQPVVVRVGDQDQVFAQVQALEADVLGSRATHNRAVGATRGQSNRFTQMTTDQIPPQETLPPPHQARRRSGRSRGYCGLRSLSSPCSSLALRTWSRARSARRTSPRRSSGSPSTNPPGSVRTPCSASNSLTAQLVQLSPTDAVLAAPAEQLGMSVSALRSAVSVGASRSRPAADHGERPVGGGRAAASRNGRPRLQGLHGQ